MTDRAHRAIDQRWDLTPAEARAAQVALADRVDFSTPLPTDWRRVAAADVSFERFGKTLYAGVVVVDRATLEEVDRATVAAPAQFPYVPGLLSFREAPAILEAFSRLKVLPDVLITDGQGRAHPRRLGIACHLGLCLDLPTVGCGKSRLCGEFDPPPINRGGHSPLVDKGETIGAVVRSRTKIAPLFVSPGHRSDLASSIALVLELTPRYRIPVPIRLAHEAVNNLRRSIESKP